MRFFHGDGEYAGEFQKKLEKKHLDMIVANNLKVEGAGFAGDTNVVTIGYRAGGSFTRKNDERGDSLKGSWMKF